MAILILFIALVVAGLAVVLSSETRDYDDRDRRRWWPGAAR
jgi:hypothetical protein